MRFARREEYLPLQLKIRNMHTGWYVSAWMHDVYGAFVACFLPTTNRSALYTIQ